MQYNSLSTEVVARLESVALDVDVVRRVIAMGLDEDLATGPDVTTLATVPLDQRSIGSLATRSAGCIAGLDIAAAVFDMVCAPGTVKFTSLVADGVRVTAGDELATVEAPTSGLLTAERTALNILCHLSGVASATSMWVDALDGTTASVRDTRKTTPGLRMLEKYAVRCGGGVNHRMSLSDAALVKDNHIVAAGGVAEAFAAVRKLAHDIGIEIEVDSLEQLREALDAGAELVLLDNMTPELMRQAVQIAKEHMARTSKLVLLEASGGITLASAKTVAQTGVNFISVGALTHSAPVLDIGLDLQSIM